MANNIKDISERLNDIKSDSIKAGIVFGMLKKGKFLKTNHFSKCVFDALNYATHNNVPGYFFDLEEIVEIAHKNGFYNAVLNFYETKGRHDLNDSLRSRCTYLICAARLSQKLRKKETTKELYSLIIDYLIDHAHGYVNDENEHKKVISLIKESNSLEIMIKSCIKIEQMYGLQEYQKEIKSHEPLFNTIIKKIKSKKILTDENKKLIQKLIDYYNGVNEYKPAHILIKIIDPVQARLYKYLKK